MNNPTAVILLSGGLDSTTCLAIAESQGFTCHALSFDYGQRHSSELEAAKAIAKQMHVAAHHFIPLNTRLFSGLLLTDNTDAIPDFETTSGIAPTYVPARNTLFLSFALAYAESIQSHDVFIGVSSIDYSGYPDCRPAFIEAFQSLANLATKAAVEGSPTRIHTPLLYLNKAQTIQAGHALGVDYALTVSCYQADKQGRACGRCDSCGFRKRGFLEAKIVDPTRYQERSTVNSL